MNKRSAFLFDLLMFQWSVVTAQKNSITISGVVTDKINKQAIEFATVQLLNIPDSSVVTSTVTDKKGKFILTDIAAGKYILQIGRAHV